MKTAIIVFGILILIGGLFCVLVYQLFQDDLYMHWVGNATDCPHTDRTDVVVSSSVTCETIHTICDDCSAVLNTRTDC